MILEIVELIIIQLAIQIKEILIQNARFRQHFHSSILKWGGGSYLEKRHNLYQWISGRFITFIDKKGRPWCTLIRVSYPSQPAASLTHNLLSWGNPSWAFSASYFITDIFSLYIIYTMCHSSYLWCLRPHSPAKGLFCFANQLSLPHCLACWYL